MKRIMILIILALAACSSKPGPKDVVFDFIDAVLESDTARVVQHLDIDGYIKRRMGAMSPSDSAVVLAAYRDSTIQQLMGEGELRERFTNWQILVNKEIKHEPLAEVEVSFINRMSRHQLYTMMQLQKQPDDTWRIVYFE